MACFVSSGISITPAAHGCGLLLGDAWPSVPLQASPNETDHAAPLADVGPTKRRSHTKEGIGKHNHKGMD